MSKRLTKHGNSLALVIDKPLLSVLKINEKTDLEILIEGDTLCIKPIKDKKKRASTLKDKELDQIAQKIMDRYEAVFKQLAKS